jgi:DNA-directed RNA polymerase I subunit RPA2
MIKCSTKFKSNQFNAFHPGRVRLRRVPQRNQSSILDKGSYERGFGAGFVYKNIVVDLKDEGGGGAAATTGRYCFDNSDEENPAGGSVGFDGLPEVGTWVEEGDALYSILDKVTNVRRVGKHKEHEGACVQLVRLLNGAAGGVGYSGVPSR